MKTSKDVRDWLKANGYWEAYVKNVISDRSTSSQDHLFCTKGINTIEYAFFWDHAPEGRDYWMNVHNRFVEWYKG